MGKKKSKLAKGPLDSPVQDIFTYKEQKVPKKEQMGKKKSKVAKGPLDSRFQDIFTKRGAEG